MKTLEMKEMITKPGEGQVMLYVDFSFVQSRSVNEVLKLLKERGYNPELRYADREGTVNLYALLKDENLTGKPSDYLADEWESLAEALGSDHMAVRCPRALLKEQTA